MTRKANKQNEESQTKEEVPAEEIPVAPETVSAEVTTARAFILKLKAEHKKDKILESVYMAFKNVVPMTDTESNYRKIWTENFKRK